MALQITYKCGHQISLENGEGSMRPDKSCFGCALRNIQAPTDGRLDRLWAQFEEATLIFRADSEGKISIGTKSGLLDMIRGEADRRNLAPHQLMILATLQLLSVPEEMLARILTEPSSAPG